MAFTTSQATDNILLRGLNFRYSNNTPPSSFFTIYASGNGHTYWSNAVSPDNLSTLSTSLGNTNNAVSTYIKSINDNIQYQSTQISTINGGNISSVKQLLANDQALSNSVNNLSNTFTQFAYQTNQKFSNYDYYISTTVNEAVINAIQYISAGIIFYDALSTIQSNMQIAVSSLSTTISATNSTLYYTTTSSYQGYVQSSLVSTTNALSNYISQVSASIVLSSDYGLFSSYILSTNQSTSLNLQQQISSLSTYTASTFGAIYNSSFSNVLSTTTGQGIRIGNLETLSTNLSSITHRWISSFVSTSTWYNNSTLYSYIQQNSNALLTTQNVLSTLTYSYSTFSTTQSTYNGKNLNNISDITGRVSTLEFEVYLITVSSILVNIWSSFYQLEQYTSSLIGQRYSTIDQYEQNVYQSTVAQNTSTSASYFNYYVSTMYDSTLSTLIPSTIAFTSSMVSTLYSTSYSYIYTQMSTVVYLSLSSFTSTSYGLNKQLIASTQSQVNSSIVGYITIPGASTINNVSTSGGYAVSTLYGNDALYSTIFFSSYAYYGKTYSTLNASTIAMNTLAYSTLSSVSYANNTLLSTSASSFTGQLNQQSTIFASTLTGLNSTVIGNSGAAYNFILASTVGAASTSAGIVTISTITSYNLFTSSLANQAGSIGVSTLYTVSTLILNSTTTTQTMDLVTYRNFTVLVNNIADNGIYRLTYNKNSLLGQDYRRGVITIDINTVGQPYSTFSGALRFDANTLGIPTTIWGAVLPTISNADYVMQYEYTIYNQILWTNLLGVYPRVRVVNPVFTAGQIFKINVGTGLSNIDNYTYFRGQSFPVSWSNYTFFPFAQVGEPPYNPQVVIETTVDGQIYNTYGPFPFSQSTATIQAPYTGAGVAPVQNAVANLYVLGYNSQAATVPFQVISPTFDYMRFRNTTTPNISTLGGNTFIAGYELVGITDYGNFPLYNTATNMYTTLPPFGSTGVTYFNMNSNYAPSKLFTNLINRIGAQGSPLTSTTLAFSSTITRPSFTELSATRGYADYIIYNLSTYFTDLITYSTIGGATAFTLTNGAVSTTIQNAQIRQINPTTYEVYNVNQSRTSNTFTSGNVLATYFFSTLSFVHTVQTPFVGPVGGPFTGPPTYFTDQQGFMEMPNVGGGGGLSARREPLSTILFYNAVTTPINSSFTVGDKFEAQVIPGDGYKYVYVMSTNASASVQVFNL